MIELKPNKQKWVKQFKPTMLKGKPMGPNSAIEERTKAEVDKLVSKMTKEVQRDLTKLFKNEEPAYMAQDASITSQARILLNSLEKKFSKIFDIESVKISKRMVLAIDKHSNSIITQSIKEITGGTVIDSSRLSNRTRETLKASINQAVDYIKSINEQYFDQIRGGVYRSITTGEGLKDLVPFLEQYEGITKKRAKNLALDQTRKAMTTVSLTRMQDAGVQKFEWIHSGGGLDPRKTHQGFSGKIYDVREPPFDKDVGRRVYPSELPNCKCTMRIVYEFAENN